MSILIKLFSGIIVGPRTMKVTIKPEEQKTWNHKITIVMATTNLQ